VLVPWLVGLVLLLVPAHKVCFAMHA